MSRPTPSWHADAQEMREGGATYREIAATLGVSQTAARYATHAPTRERINAANRRRYERIRKAREGNGG